MSALLSRRTLALVVASTLVWVQAGLQVGAADHARLRGRVISPDGSTPRAGVTIALIDEGSGRVFRSAPSDLRGAFRVDSATPGSYTLVAESSDGAFVAPEKMVLGEGDNPAIALALQPAEPTGEKEEPPEETPAGDPPEEPEAEKDDSGGDDAKAEPASSLPPPPEEKGLSPVVKGVLAGVVGLLAVAVILEVTNEEDPGSPF